MSNESIQEILTKLSSKALTIRRKIMTTLLAAGSGHVGGSLSAVDILTVLYFHVMKIDPNCPNWPDRDRFVLSKGHASAALCPILSERGFFPTELLDTFNQLDSPFSMHPDMLKIPGVDISTGSLGHGLSIALGMALAARLQKREYMTYVLMGDGELGEGSVWEAAMAASHFKVDNLLAFIDKNNLQVDGITADILNLEPLAEKWQAFGWGVREIDGHDMGAILDTIESVPFESGKPSVIIADTIKGKGLTFAENKVNFHYHDVDDEILKNSQIIFDSYEEGGEER